MVFHDILLLPMLTSQKTNLNLKFDGANLQEGTIDVFDLANTIIAFGHTVEKIADNESITRNNKIKVEVSALKPGSFDIGMIITVEQIQELATQAAPLLLVLGAVSNKAELILKIFKKVIELKKFLQGKPPKEVVIQQNGNNNVAVVYNFKGDHTEITMPVYNALQDKRIGEGIKKLTEPLKKEGGNVDEIIINGPEAEESEEVIIKKDEVEYFERVEELQTVKSYKVKGVVTAFDRKTFNGKLSINEQKRVAFEIDPRIPEIEMLNQIVERIIESLKLKINIIIEGEAVLDFESNLKKIIAQSVSMEAKLLE